MVNEDSQVQKSSIICPASIPNVVALAGTGVARSIMLMMLALFKSSSVNETEEISATA